LGFLLIGKSRWIGTMPLYLVYLASRQLQSVAKNPTPFCAHPPLAEKVWAKPAKGDEVPWLLFNAKSPKRFVETQLSWRHAFSSNLNRNTSRPFKISDIFEQMGPNVLSMLRTKKKYSIPPMPNNVRLPATHKAFSVPWQNAHSFKLLSVTRPDVHAAYLLLLVLVG